MLTNIISPSDCSACKLCCNFVRSSAWETPALEQELVYLLQEQGIPLSQRPDGSTSFFLHYCSESENEAALCPMLSTQSGCTLPRRLRPFECRIWRLRLMNVSGHLVLGLYKNCPALDNNKRCALIQFACTKLLPLLLDYAKNHPLAVRDFNPNYDVIWSEH